jgi:phage FluMu gp28-like protein
MKAIRSMKTGKIEDEDEDDMKSSLGKYFMPYQTDFISDESSLVIVEKGRQIGLSYAAAYKAVRLVTLRAARLDVWVGSRDEIQARQFLIHCQRWAKALNRAA